MRSKNRFGTREKTPPFERNVHQLGQFSCRLGHVIFAASTARHLPTQTDADLGGGLIPHSFNSIVDDKESFIREMPSIQPNSW
eukprot:scaffold932_cov207-Alexandrium_tamarense.AAC.26